MAITPMSMDSAVTGIFFKSPPIRDISCSWWQPVITLPEARNISDLKNACVIKWNSPAPQPATPSPNIM